MGGSSPERAKALKSALVPTPVFCASFPVVHGASGWVRMLAVVPRIYRVTRLLVLDLSDVEQIDADGIDALHSIAELADEDDIRFWLVVPPRGALRTCLKVVELTKLVQTFSSITDALQHHHDGPGQPLDGFAKYGASGSIRRNSNVGAF